MQVALESLQCKVKTSSMTKAGSLTFKFYIFLVDYGGNQWCNLSGCQKSCMRSHNKLVSVRVVGPPTKSYQVCPFLATISQDKSRKKRGWIKKYGWGAKKSANQRSAGKLRLNTRFEHHFSLKIGQKNQMMRWESALRKITQKQLSSDKWSSAISRHCQYLLCIPCFWSYHVSGWCVSILATQKNHWSFFLEITSLFCEMDLWRRRWRGKLTVITFIFFGLPDIKLGLKWTKI